MLTEEIMQAVAIKQPDKKYVIDLFAGGESWRPAVEQEGYDCLCPCRHQKIDGQDQVQKQTKEGPRAKAD